MRAIFAFVGRDFGTRGGGKDIAAVFGFYFFILEFGLDCSRDDEFGVSES